MKKKTNKNRRNKKRSLKIIAIILVVLAFVTVGFANYFLSKINYIANDFEYQNDGTDPSKLFDKSGVLNVLLTGSDSRTGDSEGRSDVMIVLSINKEDKTIVMTSVMRDLQVHIPGYGTTKLNAATVYGGHALLMDTIYENFGIGVDKYVAIDFYSFIDIVDAMGGVTINIDRDEINGCNKSINELNRIQGLDPEDGYITEAGEQILTGKQALAYSRLRYVGNADYERTARQRLVLTAVINKMHEMNIVELLAVANAVLPEITTNLLKQDITELLLILLNSKAYNIIENRIPMEGENVNITDFTRDIEMFHQLVYGE